MKADISLVDNGRIIQIVYHEDVGPDDFDIIWKKAKEISDDNNTSGCIADNRRIKTDPSIREIFKMPKTMENIDIPKTMRFAVIVREDAPKGIGPFFFETVCRNRGYRVKVVKDRKKAIDWINENKK